MVSVPLPNAKAASGDKCFGEVRSPQNLTCGGCKAARSSFTCWRSVREQVHSAGFRTQPLCCSETNEDANFGIAAITIRACRRESMT